MQLHRLPCMRFHTNYTFIILPDSFTPITKPYSTSSIGDGSNYINFTNNVLRVISHIDRDGQFGQHEFHNLTFIVTDAARHEVKATRTIRIVDINDNAPTFSSNVYTVNVTENATSRMCSASDYDLPTTCLLLFNGLGSNTVICDTD